MASDYYLLKTEPTGYSFADLQRDSVTEWDRFQPGGVEKSSRNEARHEIGHL